MRIVTGSNGKKKIKISKSEWVAIGKGAGWKVAQFNEEYEDSLARGIVAAEEAYRGFVIKVYPTDAKKSYYYTKIDGVLIPNDFESTPKFKGQGTTNAIMRGKKAIDKAILDNPHGADKDVILKNHNY